MDEQEISNPEKRIFSKYTKKDYIEYYQKIARVMLPSIRGRPLVFYRFPNGTDKAGFFQKNIPYFFPAWIKHVKVHKKNGFVNHIICKDEKCLIYVASQVAEIHTWTTSVENLKFPDKMIFDLDPNIKNLKLLKNTARKLGKLLKDIGFVPYIMATGKKGYHIFVPIKPELNNNKVRDFALKIARVLEGDDTKNITTEMSMEKRVNKIFIDVNRNSTQQNAIAPYSIRATPKATVAVPIEWGELSQINPDSYDIKKTLNRMKRKKDPLRNFSSNAKSLKSIIMRLKNQRREI